LGDSGEESGQGLNLRRRFPAPPKDGNLPGVFFAQRPEQRF
jgi:hypothetical protein